MYESYRGSSPRVWGIPGEDAAGVLTTRFIPTRVGNTLVQGRRAEGQAVHPHACGEYVRLSGALERGPGSSPRVWGIHMPKEPMTEERRFIPTRVGNTVGNHSTTT